MFQHLLRAEIQHSNALDPKQQSIGSAVCDADATELHGVIDDIDLAIHPQGVACVLLAENLDALHGAQRFHEIALFPGSCLQTLLAQ